MTAVIAPGGPGILPKWTSGAKIGVGTAMSGDSNVWFTISHGILNEVYFPRIDNANVRDMEFLITDGVGFFSEERRHAIHEYGVIAGGIPAYHVTNTCLEGRYQIQKKIITDSRRNVVLQEVQFTPLKGGFEDFHLYAILAPHICNAGNDNNGWSEYYKGFPMLFAQRSGVALAFACSEPFLAMTCGYVGVSDAWQDLNQNKRLTQIYPKATGGNISLCGEIDLKACGGRFVIAISFAHIAEEAGLQARAALFRDFDWALSEYLEKWQNVQNKFTDLSTVDREGGSIFHISTAVIKTHEGKHFSGSVIASLSIPWGFSKGDNDLGGYHLIWPRDQVQTALAFLAAGDNESAREALLFLMCTQESNGHWAQCMWEDGTPYWRALQMDETALPIILADHLERLNILRTKKHRKMIAKAASFIVQHGPVTEQDRWEENGGYTPFTIATQIAALLIAADKAEDEGFIEEAEYLRDTADWWNESIERWLYVENTEISREVGVKGYYVRVTPFENFEDTIPSNKDVVIKNRPVGENIFPYTHIVSVDALALVRYGLRKADDPRIVDTVKVIDYLLKTETPKGIVWHRYNEDGYGEHKDGSPYDGTGIGRGWPLLAGERAHYELAKGNKKAALELLRTMAKMAGVGGLLPEQIWDSEDIPERSLYKGHSAGSAKPLVWAHAEYITLLRSIAEDKIFNMPPHTVQRYLEDDVKAKCAIWRFNHQCLQIPQGIILRIQTNYPAQIRWTIDNWQTDHDSETKSLALGISYTDLPVENAPSGSKVIFTIFWPEQQKWEGRNFEVQIQ